MTPDTKFQRQAREVLREMLGEIRVRPEPDG
jgi:hypothetical protein